MVSGCTVVIHTDHLNNTVLNVDLKAPDKILRMLMKIHTTIDPVWMFQPGKGQLGHGFSRNPVDRDAVRELTPQEAGLPKTLKEAFDRVSKSNRTGGPLEDDCDAYTQQFSTVFSPSTEQHAVDFLPVSASHSPATDRNGVLDAH